MIRATLGLKARHGMDTLMQVNRATPNLTATDLDASLEFYVDVLGFEERMNLGWIATVGSPSHPHVLLSLLTEDVGGPVVPDVSIGVDDVDTAYEAVVAAGAEIVYPLTDEAWGVRRFFARDPGGRVVNVLQHIAAS